MRGRLLRRATGPVYVGACVAPLAAATAPEPASAPRVTQSGHLQPAPLHQYSVACHNRTEYQNAIRDHGADITARSTGGWIAGWPRGRRVGQNALEVMP